jgi:hypothetical protein
VAGLGVFLDVVGYSCLVQCCVEPASGTSKLRVADTVAGQLLSQIKRFQATSEIVSNEPLLAQTPGDVANPVNRRIFGVPLYSVPESTDSLPTIPDGVVWAIAADKSFTILRQDLSAMANPYSAFSSDSTQVRGVMRAAFGFTQPDCVVQIVSGGS